jgi:K+-transporting ATPase ATPase C chain
MKTIIQSIRILIVFTLLTGGVYPLAVMGFAKAFCPKQASGSLIVVGDKTVGSELLAQKFEGAQYFWPRPSAGDYATVASGASNKGPTSSDLAKAIHERRTKFGTDAPSEMITASGSGLDPHISPEAAKYQASRVATERKMPVAQVNALVEKFTEPQQLGVFGEPRVNVLLLNLELDK